MRARKHYRAWRGRTPPALRCAGFTLLEVAVALGIAAFVLAGVIASIAQKIDASTTMRERTYASWIAQNKITELRLENVVPEVSQTNGELEYAGLEWAWEATISETGVENLFRVDVDVSFADRDGRIMQMTGFIGEPTIPGESNRAWSVGSQDAGERR